MRRQISLQIVLVLATASQAHAAVIHVPADYNTIQAAVDAAADGDEIVLADGTYTRAGNWDIAIGGLITIRSENGPERCIIDCNDSGPKPQRHFAFRTYADRVTLEGLRIINGGGNEGSAIMCDGGRLVMVNCGFAHNVSRKNGGAIYLRHKAQADIINCTLTDNTAESGGAVFCSPTTNLLVINSLFVNNSATAKGGLWGGGAIACEDDSQLSLIDSKLHGNSAADSGGALYCRGIRCLRIDKCSISDNCLRGDPAQLRGAGVFVESEYTHFAMSITDSAITRNLAVASQGWQSLGGGLHLHLQGAYEPEQVIIKNCTIAENQVRAGRGGECEGAGIYIDGGYHEGQSDVILTDCVISRNCAGEPNERTSYSQGGGLYCWRAQPILLKCRIQGNTAGTSAGMYFRDGAAIITNCLVSGNVERWPGEAGCIVFDDCRSSANVVNSTIVGNTFCGIACYCSSFEAKIANSIVFYNGPPEVASYDQMRGYLEVSYSCVQQGWLGRGNIDCDPCFVTPGYWDTNGTGQFEDDFWVEGDYHLLPDSNCIDAGGPPRWLMDSTDLDGSPRIAGSQIDMGAYEFSMPEFEVDLQINPRTLNAKSRGKFISAVLTFPPQLDALDVPDEPLTLYPGEIPSQKCRRSGNKITCKFDRRQLIAALPDRVETVEIEVVGRLTTGQYFYGTDTIKIVGRD